MNRVVIEPTRFINVRTGHESLGYRIYDGEDISYNSTWKDIPKDDVEVLRRVLASGSEVEEEMLGSAWQERQGIVIGGAVYAWAAIQPIMDEHFL